MAHNFVGTHNDWKTLKKQHGIPDKVCPFSFGEKIGAYDKAVAKLGIGKAADYQTENKITLDMLLTVRTYAAALAKLKPEKFKGKNAGEQTKSFNAAKAAVADMVKSLDGHLKELKIFVEPFSKLLEEFPKAEQKYKTLKKTDLQGLKDFNSKELRNDLGLYIDLALKLKIGNQVKAALQTYKDLLDRLTQVENRHEDPPQGMTEAQFIHQLSGEALAAIKPYIQ